MSRIGKKPVLIPKGVSVTVESDRLVKVKGPNGSLERVLPELVSAASDGSSIVISTTNSTRASREQHGLSRSLVANMVEGVSKGFAIALEITGVGYRAQVQGKKLILSMGYSHPVELEAPDGVKVAVEKNTSLTISGPNKEEVGNFAAKVRAVRPPEPYKGKGIRYSNERIIRKAGKSGKK